MQTGILDQNLASPIQNRYLGENQSSPNSPYANPYNHNAVDIFPNSKDSHENRKPLQGNATQNPGVFRRSDSHDKQSEDPNHETLKRLDNDERYKSEYQRPIFLQFKKDIELAIKQGRDVIPLMFAYAYRNSQLPPDQQATYALEKYSQQLTNACDVKTSLSPEKGESLSRAAAYRLSEYAAKKRNLDPKKVPAAQFTRAIGEVLEENCPGIVAKLNSGDDMSSICREIAVKEEEMIRGACNTYARIVGQSVPKGTNIVFVSPILMPPGTTGMNISRHGCGPGNGVIYVAMPNEFHKKSNYLQEQAMLMVAVILAHEIRHNKHFKGQNENARDVIYSAISRNIEKIQTMARRAIGLAKDMVPADKFHSAVNDAGPERISQLYPGKPDEQQNELDARFAEMCVIAFCCAIATGCGADGSVSQFQESYGNLFRDIDDCYSNPKSDKPYAISEGVKTVMRDMERVIKTMEIYSASAQPSHRLHSDVTNHQQR